MRHQLGATALAVLLAAAPVLAACGPRAETSCTDVGCSSVVRLDGIDIGTVAEVEVCVADEPCERHVPTLGGTLAVTLPEALAQEGEELEVEVTLHLGDGTSTAGAPVAAGERDQPWGIEPPATS